MKLPQKDDIIVTVTTYGEIIGKVEEVDETSIVLSKPHRLAFQFVPSKDGKMMEFASMIIPILCDKTSGSYIYVNPSSIIGWYLPDPLIKSEYLEKVSGLTIPHGADVQNLLKS
ncbi:MAG: hypothetical protein ABIM22_07705 [candidate division WOR-3 bacterium]